MSVIWIDEISGPRLELETVLRKQWKMDLARQLAAIRKLDHVPVELSRSEIIDEILAELSDANVKSMLAAYSIVAVNYR